MAVKDFSLSIVIPVFNEECNLEELQRRIVAVMTELENEYEVIYVNDGSSDESAAILDKLAAEDQHVKVLHFMRNYGQTAAIAAGVDHAEGDAVCFMDADLQNDPADIPAMLAKLDEGHGVVSGWRKHRKDGFFLRKLPSRIANRMISSATGVKLHDYGCTLKIYRKKYLQGFHLYGEMHRFLPAYAHQAGADIVEMPVRHHPRIHGKSKYGLERTFKVILDLFTVKFLGEYAHKPIYLFGGVGFGMMILSVALVAFLVIDKLVRGSSMVESPLLLLSAILVVIGVQSVFLGLISELLMRTYHESQQKATYTIDRTSNLRRE